MLGHIRRSARRREFANSTSSRPRSLAKLVPASTMLFRPCVVRVPGFYIRRTPLVGFRWLVPIRLFVPANACTCPASRRTVPPIAFVVFPESVIVVVVVATFMTSRLDRLLWSVLRCICRGCWPRSRYLTGADQAFLTFPTTDLTFCDIPLTLSRLFYSSFDSICDNLLKHVGIDCGGGL